MQTPCKKKRSFTMCTKPLAQQEARNDDILFDLDDLTLNNNVEL